MTLGTITIPSNTRFFPLNENAQFKGMQVMRYYALQIVKEFNKRQKELVGYTGDVTNVNLVTTNGSVANRQYFFEFNDEDVKFSDLFMVKYGGSAALPMSYACNLTGDSNYYYYGMGDSDTPNIDFFANYCTTIGTYSTSEIVGDLVLYRNCPPASSDKSYILSNYRLASYEKNTTDLFMHKTEYALDSNARALVDSEQSIIAQYFADSYSGNSGERTPNNVTNVKFDSGANPHIMLTVNGTAYVPEVIDDSYTGNLATINGTIQIIIPLLSAISKLYSWSRTDYPQYPLLTHCCDYLFFKENTYFRCFKSGYRGMITRKQDIVNLYNCIGIPFALEESSVQLPISELPDYDPNAKYIPPNYVPEPYYLTKSLTKNECYTFDEENGYQRVPVEEVTLETIKQYGGRVMPTCNETLQEFGDFQLYMYDETALFEPEVQSTGTMFTPIHMKDLKVEHQIVSATTTSDNLGSISVTKDGHNYYFDGANWVHDEETFTSQEVFNAITEEQWALLGAGVYDIHPILLNAYSSFKSITISYF